MGFREGGEKLSDEAKEMTSDKEFEKEVAEIIGDLKCPKNFKCYRSGFEALCKADDIGLESYLDCLEDNAFECKFAFSFGEGYFCKCPLRVYLAKNLNK